jgi:hypothetical protein
MNMPAAVVAVAALSSTKKRKKRALPDASSASAPPKALYKRVRARLRGADALSAAEALLWR